MSYLAVKHLHVTAVVISLAFFALRGAWMLADSRLLQARLVRVAPHVVDTVLLGSAVWLAAAVGQYPFVDGWITAKVVGLVAYVVLGTIALRRGRSRSVRAVALVGAMGTAAYIVAVALTKNPLPWTA